MSAFEEALFRVYDRSMMNLIDDNNADDEDGCCHLSSKYCGYLEKIMLILVGFYLVATLTLHTDFVGSPGCLPAALKESQIASNRSELFPEDSILQINIASDFKDIPIGLISDDDIFSLGDESNAYRRLRRLDIKQPQPITEPGLQMLSRALSEKEGSKSPSQTHTTNTDADTNTDTDTDTKIAKNVTDIETVKNITEVPLAYRLKYDYEYSTSASILTLNKETRAKHNFELINITLSSKECFGSNSFAQFLVSLGGIDHVVMNNIAASLKQPGMMTTWEDKYYLWRMSDLVLYTHAGQWTVFKIIMLVKTCFLFVVLSHTSALLVRILVSSGAVFIYMTILCQSGQGGAGEEDGDNAPGNAHRRALQRLRHVSLAYPWLGVPVQMHVSRHQSPWPYVTAHLSKIFMYYVYYEALQFALSSWVYGNSTPSSEDLWLYSAMMVWEYISMIYVRAAPTIILFPRALFACFLIYHFYIFSFPLGFHMMALTLMMTTVSWVIIYCILRYEKQAFTRGIVNSDEPRAFSNQVAWPLWNHSLAPDFTVFMPVVRRATTVYGAIVEPLHVDAEAGHATGNDASGNTHVQNPLQSTASESEMDRNRGNPTTNALDTHTDRENPNLNSEISEIELQDITTHSESGLLSDR